MIRGGPRRTLPTARAVQAAAAAFLLLSFASSGRAAGDLPDVQPVLTKARALVQDFAERLNSIRYEEEIVQEKLKNDGKVQYQQQTLFDSLVLLRFNNGEINVEESRLVEKRPPRAELRPLVQSSGFSTLAMIFHPYYESSFQFARLEDDAINGKRLARVSFEYVPGQRSPTLYQMPSGNKPLSLSGTAWIDPDSGEIYRIVADVGSTLEDLGLKVLHTELEYAPVTFVGDPQVRWLPVGATIDLETPHQHWRNIHHFSNYRRYAVDVKIEPVSNQP